MIDKDDRAKQAQADISVLRSLWARVGLFGFFVSLASLLGMMGEDSPFDPLKFSKQGAYTLTLFAIPVLAFTCMVIAWIGRRYVIIANGRSWFQRIPSAWDIKELEQSTYRRHVAIFSLMVCLGIPLIGTVWSFAKMMHGTYYFMPVDRGGCNPRNRTPSICVPQGAVMDKFWPDNGIGNPFQTRYAYEGNKDFIPVLEPTLYGILVLFAFGMSGRMIAAIRSHALDRATSNQ